MRENFIRKQFNIYIFDAKKNRFSLLRRRQFCNGPDENEWKWKNVKEWEKKKLKNVLSLADEKGSEDGSKVFFVVRMSARSFRLLLRILQTPKKKNESDELFGCSLTLSLLAMWTFSHLRRLHRLNANSHCNSHNNSTTFKMDSFSLSLNRREWSLNEHLFVFHFSLTLSYHCHSCSHSIFSCLVYQFIFGLENGILSLSFPLWCNNKD